LDSAGGGGSDIVFQTGPNSPWLVEVSITYIIFYFPKQNYKLFLQHYKNSAKHPLATTMAEEIFQTGILPSDTDYGIFVKYGNLIGKSKSLS